MGEDDWSFVLDAWSKSYANSKFATMRGSRYWAEQERIERWCIGSGKVLIAHAEDDPDTILGFICGRRDPETVHYVYCKHAARRLGVASLMIEALLGKPWRETKPRMSHKPYTKIRQMVEAAGWVFAPVTNEEMA